MNKPTPGKVAQWAREADVWVAGQEPYQSQLYRLVTRAMAEQAEADAKLCETDYEPGSWDEHAAACNECAASIRANAPKL